MKKIRDVIARIAPPAPGPADLRCRHCRNLLERHINPVVPQGEPVYTTPLGERVPAGVALPNECPKQPLGGTSFGRHEPM